jgi:hypothetical protein
LQSEAVITALRPVSTCTGAHHSAVLIAVACGQSVKSLRGASSSIPSQVELAHEDFATFLVDECSFSVEFVSVQFQVSPLLNDF